MRALLLFLPVAAFILQIDKVWPFPEAPALNPRIVKDQPKSFETLPARNIGKFNRPADPLNMIFVGSEQNVVAALESAGWTRIPVPISESFFRGLEELWKGHQLRSFPPMSDFRVLGRVQDMNWVQVVIPIEKRHHFRLWRTGLYSEDGREVWWGSGNFDLSVRYRDLSHRPDPDMNMERDYVGQTLEGSPLVRSMKLLPLPQIPLKGENAHGYPFFTDGKALIVELK